MNIEEIKKQLAEYEAEIENTKAVLYRQQGVVMYLKAEIEKAEEKPKKPAKK